MFLSEGRAGESMQEKTGRQEEYYIGIDLDDEWTQISYFWPGMKEPETVSMVAGGEQYRIPTALYRPGGYGSWHLRGSGPPPQEPGSRYIEDLWGKSRRQEVIAVPQECEAQELFVVFLRKVIWLVPGLSDVDQIRAVTFHLKEMSREAVLLLKSTAWRIGIEKARVFIQDDAESFCHFAMNQETELMQHDVALFVCEKQELSCYYLTKEQKKLPAKVDITCSSLGMLPEDGAERDAVFAQEVRKVFQGKIISSVYLAGAGLEGGWMKESVQVLCRGRRAFQGKNLYTKGACYGSIMQRNKERVKYVYFSDHKLASNIFIQVQNGERKFFYDLAEAGSSCFEMEKSCQVLLDGDGSVDIWMQAPDSGKARIESLVLTGLPKRPPKATRLMIELLASQQQEIRIRITDVGFGPWYPSSGKVWEYCINE